MRLLDTDILIDLHRGHPAAVTWYGALTEVPSVPGFVVMELVQDAPNIRLVRKALKLVAPFPVVWPTEIDCIRALSDFCVYHRKHGIGLLDSLIAACAIGCSATLCTFNAKHFRVIPGLAMELPYSR